MVMEKKQNLTASNPETVTIFRAEYEKFLGQEQQLLSQNERIFRLENQVSVLTEDVYKRQSWAVLPGRTGIWPPNASISCWVSSRRSCPVFWRLWPRLSRRGARPACWCLWPQGFPWPSCIPWPPAARLCACLLYTSFFSFGTNDLTQMTFGFSRDDAGKFLDASYDKKIYEFDPFAHLDQHGVGCLCLLYTSPPGIPLRR